MYIYRKALKDELRTLSLCSHPNVVQLLGQDENNGLLLEFVQRGNARQFLRNGHELQ